MKLFLPNATLEQWTVDEKADVNAGQLIIRETKASHPVVPAVHFARLVSGDDIQSLVGKVKTGDQLSAMSAEQMNESVIVGETAYEVVSGFIAEVAAAAPAKPEKKKGASPEADLLAAFILDKL